MTCDGHNTRMEVAMTGAPAMTATRALAALVAWAGFAGAAEAKPPRAVIELFTSQGCSSCPPADALLAKLATDADLIALSLPVDYWDRLGWKDTFAKHAFTERQAAYANVRGDGEVYTPQAVVNGTKHAIGSQRGAINAAVAGSASRLSVPVSVTRAADVLQVSVGAGVEASPARATLVLLPYLGARDVAIGRGENARRTITYTNIVRDIVALGEWNGKPIARTIPLKDYKNYDGLVVLLQAGSPGNPGAILGAGRIALR
jgi:hypothetical protein